MLTKQIRVCAGCRLGYNNEIVIPSSPYNICIAHEESRQVTPTSGKTPFTTKSTVHYHANPSCIWMKNASFVPQNIQIPPGISAQLDENNKYYLMEYFNTYLFWCKYNYCSSLSYVLPCKSIYRCDQTMVWDYVQPWPAGASEELQISYHHARGLT